MKKLKVGMVGIWRGTAYGRIFSSNPKTQVTALCDIDSHSLADSGKEFKLQDNQLFDKYEDLLNTDVDIIVLGTPIPDHACQTVKALECNKHVLCEVTAADTLKGCNEIYRAVNRSKAKYMLAENCNYYHFIRQWKNYVEQGKIGNIFYAEGDYVHEIRNKIIDPMTGSIKWRAGRAPIHYCSHSLGPILYLMDDYVVKATCSGNKATIIKNVGVGAIDMQVALFETRKGSIIKVLRSSTASRKPQVGSYSIYGTRGFLEAGRSGIEEAGNRYFEGIDKDGTDLVCPYADPDAPEEALMGGHGTSEYFLVADFLHSIENNSVPPVDVVKAMDMTIPGLIAHEAAMKGNVWLDVPRII